MKRFACTALILLFLCSLCACSAKQEAALPKIGICYSQNNLNTAYQEALPAALEKAGFQVTVVDGKNDHTIQQRQISDFLKQDYALLIIEPVLIDASGDLVSQLQEADVPGVFINREPGEAALSGWDRVCYIGCDAIQPGILQGRIVLNVQWMSDLELVDDRKTAEQIVHRCISRGYGLSRAKQALYEKQIPKTYWEEALADYPDQTEKIIEFFQSRLGENWDEKELRRATEALMRRGHSYSEIRRGLEQFRSETDFPEDY